MSVSSVASVVDSRAQSSLYVNDETREKAILKKWDPNDPEMEAIIKRTAAIAIRYVTGKHRPSVMNDASAFFTMQYSAGLSLKERLAFILFYTKKEFWKDEAEAFVRDYFLEHLEGENNV